MQHNRLLVDFKKKFKGIVLFHLGIKKSNFVEYDKFIQASNKYRERKLIKDVF